MNSQQKTLQAQIEEQTGRELADLRYDDDALSIEFFKKKFGVGDYRRGEILLADGQFDLKYVASKPYEPTEIKTAGNFEDGVEVVASNFARETDMEVDDVQRQIENII